MFKEKIIRISVLIFFVSVLVLPIFSLQKDVQATAMAQTYMRLDRVKASTPTTGLICATTSSVNGTEAKVAVTFPTGFTLGAFGTFAVATSNLPNGATIWPGITAPAGAGDIVGQTVTFASTDLAINTQYCFRWTSTTAISTGTAGNDKPGIVTTQTSAPATIDSGNYAVSVITNDQIGVTATVPLTYSMTLDTTTIALGTLSTTTTSSTGNNVTIATNAAAGWIAWVSGTNGTTSLGALHSTVANSDISAPGASSDNTPTDLASTPGYVLDVDVTDSGTAGTGTVSQASNFGAEFNGTNTTSGGSITTLLQPIAAANGVTDGDILSLKVRAKITALQAAASDYADTLTVVSTGRF